jgi:ubiquinone biosynthesis protein COQ9
MQVDEATAAVLDALLPQIPFDGWTETALRNALKSIGQPPEDAKLIFPGGPGDMIEAFCALSDARMEQAARAADLTAARVPARVKAILAIRFEQNRGDKEAIRRALSWLALPNHTRRAARITAATVDAVWHAAGDSSADFSWYTKRGILAAVYSATLLFWLADNSAEDEATIRFLDRRLAGVARIGKFRKRVEDGLKRIRPRLPGLA